MNIRRILSPLTTYGLFAVMCGTLALASSTETSALYSTRRCNYVEVVSHRGAVTAARTENTMRAFYYAASLGARTLETDLQLTSDGKWVLMHDLTVDRTTLGPNTGTRVSSLTLAQIKSLKTNNGVVGGVPSAQTLVNYAKAHPSIKLQLEIKTTAASYESLRELLTMLANAGIKDRVMITSFSITPLSRVKAIDPTWNRGLVTGPRVTTTKAKAYASNVITNQRNITATYVTDMRNAGVNVYAWTPNTKTVWRKVVRMGVNGVTTDKVNLVRHYCTAARR